MVRVIRWGAALCLVLTLAHCSDPAKDPASTAARGPILRVDRSPYGFDETVERIVPAATAAGWKVPITHDLQASLRSAGYGIRQTAVIELCKPEVSYRILRSDSLRHLSALMPCRVAVFEREGGSVLISRMDPDAFEGAFAGEAGEVLREASDGIESMLAGMLQATPPPKEHP